MLCIENEGVEGGDMLIQHALQVLFSPWTHAVDTGKDDRCCQEHAAVAAGDEAGCAGHDGNALAPDRSDQRNEGRCGGNRQPAEAVGAGVRCISS